MKLIINESIENKNQSIKRGDVRGPYKKIEDPTYDNSRDTTKDISKYSKYDYKKGISEAVKLGDERGPYKVKKDKNGKPILDAEGNFIYNYKRSDKAINRPSAAKWGQDKYLPKDRKFKASKFKAENLFDALDDQKLDWYATKGKDAELGDIWVLINDVPKDEFDINYNPLDKRTNQDKISAARSIMAKYPEVLTKEQRDGNEFRLFIKMPDEALTENYSSDGEDSSYNASDSLEDKALKFQERMNQLVKDLRSFSQDLKEQGYGRTAANMGRYIIPGLEEWIEDSHGGGDSIQSIIDEVSEKSDSSLDDSEYDFGKVIEDEYDEYGNLI